LPERIGAGVAFIVVLCYRKCTIMSTKQTIAIIGATGNMGSALAKTLSKGNNRLLLFANNQDKVKALVDDIKSSNKKADVEGIECPTNASWEADIIVMAVPYTAEKEIATRIKEVANQKVVISISNPLNENYDGLVTPPDTSAAEELQKLMPNSKVVKAFNTVFASVFTTPEIDGKQVDVLIAGNDGNAMVTVSELVQSAGFNPLVTGELLVSRTLENMALLLIQLTVKNNWNWQSGFKVLHN
jgi:8-hydroxy-5-deazaflavin:NADPH oxidoreductase